MKRCAVIGSNGYIGKHIAYYLYEHYHVDVECYDIEDHILPNYTHINLLDKESLKKIDFSVDYIFFFAGLTGTYVGFEKYHDYVCINELGLLNFLDVMVHTPFRPHIVFPSSRLVYKGVDRPLKETDEKQSKTIYSVNKIACEKILEAYNYSFDLSYSIFRICVPYGNLLNNDYSFGTVGYFIRQASNNKDITIYGDGNLKRTFTHIADLCYQIIEGAFANTECDIFNVGGETLSLMEAACIVASKYGVSVVRTDWPKIDSKIESGHTYFDDSKIRSLINFSGYKRLIDFTSDL